MIYRYLSTFHHEYERKSGSATLAINEWISYYNVRLNPLDLIAGHEYIIKVKPVQHIATNRVKGYDIHTRKCQFPEENQVKQSFFIFFEIEHHKSCFRTKKACLGSITKQDASLSAG